MTTPPTSYGMDKEQPVDLTNDLDDGTLSPHLSDCECTDDFGPVPPGGNPSLIDGMTVGDDPYSSDWNR
jgi:hypothetical protein